MATDDLLASGPPVGDEEEDADKFMGVPKGYTANRLVPRPLGPGGPQPMGVVRGAVPGVMGQVAPLYREGEQYRPGGGRPEDIARLQVQLDGAGLMKKGYRLGVWDEESIAGYSRLLKYANQQGHDAKTALDALGTLTAEEREELGLDSRAKAERAPMVISVSHPEDLKAVANKTARQILGKNLSDEELNRFVSAYQGMQSSSQAATYGARETGGTVTQEPEAATAAEAQIRQAHPTETFGNDLLDVYDRALKIFGVGG
jgi:hypothetical protein